ncbi:MAG: RnfABCDGE type electron transport complex subunit B [Candidatus Omnitrophica bacterium]|nr:RnfABCDGE type electron transport complex subunit B [Candidatus Omnitrophota bacterium]
MKEIIIPVLVLGLTGFGFSLLLALLSKKLKVEENPRVAKVLELLPGLNCGACGLSGCRAFAEAVAEKCDVFSGCLPATAEVNKQIAETLGLIGCISSHTQVVICHCSAKKGEKKASSKYLGPNTCQAANLSGGMIDCVYGCLALDDCLRVCPVDALGLFEQSIHVDFKKCTGCGACLKACPRNLFELVPIKKGLPVYNVACSNKETAPGVRKVCNKGCIGCALCTKIENSPYQMRDNLSVINYDNPNDQNTLEQGKNKCPTKCITNQNLQNV